MWNYRCDTDNLTLTADSKEELAEKVMKHANEQHDMQMTREQAMESVNKNATQAA